MTQFNPPHPGDILSELLLKPMGFRSQRPQPYLKVLPKNAVRDSQLDIYTILTQNFERFTRNIKT